MNILNLFQRPQTVAIHQAPGQLPVQVLKEEPPSIGKENEHIITALTNVKKVALQLCRQGFKPLDITIGNRNPVIIINPSKRCSKLTATVIKRSRLQNCIMLTYAASIDGVQVQWMVPDHE